MENHPLLLGHRGARADKSVPENTLVSFDLALGSGGDGFEFDVRLSGDGQAVICHDARIEGRSLEIAKSSQKELDLPTLREVLTRYQRSAFLDIELKVDGLESVTSDLLHEIPPARGFVISSFLPQAIATLRSIDAAIPLGLICETREELSRWPQLPIDYVIPHHKLVRQESVRKMKAAGKKIFVWTVNSASDMRRFSKWGVDGIVSDDPKELVRILRE
jgi:glycerophosphoryl diester phosphodiesterase